MGTPRLRRGGRRGAGQLRHSPHASAGAAGGSRQSRTRAKPHRAAEFSHAGGALEDQPVVRAARRRASTAAATWPRAGRACRKRKRRRPKRAPGQGRASRCQPRGPSAGSAVPGDGPRMRADPPCATRGNRLCFRSFRATPGGGVRLRRGRSAGIPQTAGDAHPPAAAPRSIRAVAAGMAQTQTPAKPPAAREAVPPEAPPRVRGAPRGHRSGGCWPRALPLALRRRAGGSASACRGARCCGRWTRCGTEGAIKRIQGRGSFVSGPLTRHSSDHPMAGHAARRASLRQRARRHPSSRPSSTPPRRCYAKSTARCCCRLPRACPRSPSPSGPR